MIRKIEPAAGFTILDRSSAPLAPTDAGRDFIREAQQILLAAQDQVAARQQPRTAT
jgi:DNA-binding transcriptional LysR family regulator